MATRNNLWYNVNSAKEKQAAHSDICFSCAFNEQTVCAADTQHEVRVCECEQENRHEVRVCECNRKTVTKCAFASATEKPSRSARLRVQ